MRNFIFLFFIALFTNLFAEKVNIQKVDPEKIVSRFPKGGSPLLKDLKPFVFKCAKGQSLPYLIYRPEDVAKKLPLVIFLHGIGEAGSDNMSQLKHAEPLSFINRKIQKQYPCYFIAPQHPSGLHWGTISITNPSSSLKKLSELVQNITITEKIDASRIYITGLSSGGWGAFDAVTLYPDVYAAAIVVSSGADPKLVVARGQARPIWFSCNSNDKGIYQAVTGSAKALAEMNSEVHISVAENRGGHSAWQWAFFDQAMIKWLFAQRIVR